MSAANQKWELGVVAFYEDFENFDQYTKLGAAYTALADGETTRTLTLDSTISSDYHAAPFCLSPMLAYVGPQPAGQAIMGPPIIVGPSTDSTWEGAIDQSAIHQWNSLTVARQVYNKSLYHLSHVMPAYASGDPVLIRTVPHGWTTNGTFKTLAYMVMPIGRYDDRQPQPFVRSNTIANQVNIDTETAYRMETQRAVRMATNTNVADEDRYIYRLTDLNTVSPRIRRWRASWYYRLARASAGGSAVDNPRAAVRMHLCTADGNLVANNWSTSGESSIRRTTTREYTAMSSATADWQLDTLLFGPFGTTDTAGWLWDYDDDPNKSPLNRVNRLRVDLRLSAGSNTAFDVDDFVIEHAHGTSDEANGFYEIDDHPEQGTITWSLRENNNRFVTANNRLHLPQTSINRKRKYHLSAEFLHVSSQILTDLYTLIDWQKRGHLIALRPYMSTLPGVLVGVLSVSRVDTRMWDLGKVSFTLEFEEA